MELMNAIAQTFKGTEMQVVLLLVGLDLVTGIVSALVKKRFDFGKVADWLAKDFIVYYLAAGVFAAIMYLQPGLNIAADLGPGAAAVALIASIWSNVKELKTPS